ncbi:MAG: hypothetical protein ABJM86_00070 [Hyphomicrobiales bacterium]
MVQFNNENLEDLISDQKVHQTLIDNNVNLVSGLATNYLNHYIEILLLIEMLPDMRECFEDIRTWKPMSYCEHAACSELPNSDLVLKVYDSVDAQRRKNLSTIAHEADKALTSFVNRAGTALDLNDANLLKEIAIEAKEYLTPIIERMTGVITPSAKTTTPFVSTL